MGKDTDPIRLFAVSGRDPVACIGIGMHHLLSGEMLRFGVHFCLLVSWTTCLGVYVVVRNQFLDVCCYGKPGPTTAEYKSGGRCTDPQSRMHTQSGVCESTPVSQLVPLVLCCFFVLMQVVYYFWTYRHYEEHVQGELRRNHANLHDVQRGVIIRKQVQCLQLFPITGILLGLPEKEAGRFFGLRVVALVLCVVTIPMAIVAIIPNIDWGCYWWVYDNDKMDDKRVLAYGLCWDENSVAFQYMHGSYAIWETTWYYVSAALVSIAMWMYLFFGRLLGVWIGSVELMRPLHEDYVRKSERYFSKS